MVYDCYIRVSVRYFCHFTLAYIFIIFFLSTRTILYIKKIYGPSFLNLFSIPLRYFIMFLEISSTIFILYTIIFLLDLYLSQWDSVLKYTIIYVSLMLTCFFVSLQFSLRFNIKFIHFYVTKIFSTVTNKILNIFWKCNSIKILDHLY